MLRKELMGQIMQFKSEIFFKNNYQKRMNSPIVTTGNELVKGEIGEFSKKLCMEELYNYVVDVDKSTTAILKTFTYSDIKTKITEEKRKKLERLNVVSKDENVY